MKIKNLFSKSFLLLCVFFFISLFTGCTPNAGPCPTQPYADLSNAEAFAQDNELPFRFPLDDANSYRDIEPATFCSANRKKLDAPYSYHAAEDYFQPPGTPVYAMADGNVSFSGPMGGYGWLIIIDHPQANLYTLYGHLSPSRWYMETGPVSKGDLIAYLGDSHENGGSLENPLEPHLHLGIRAGQRNDYPAKGEWRWMAGWIHLCPADIGWLRPSEIITGQHISAGGYSMPDRDFLTMWGVEALFGLIYLASGIGTIIYTTKKKKLLVPLLGSVVYAIAGWIFLKDGWKIGPLMFIFAALFLIFGIVQFTRRSQPSE